MEITEYINQMKEFYDFLLSFLENEDDIDEYDFENLINFFERQKFKENREELKNLLNLISIISKNHHRHHYFINRIEKILLYFKEDIKQTFSNSEIFEFFKNDKRILLFLFKNEILMPNDFILNYILETKERRLYFYDEIKIFINQEQKESIENELSNLDKDTINNYEEKCQIGENDSYICELIRNDSVDEFIIYMNKTNLSLSETKIKPSIYETNLFLLDKKPTMIEYAVFFGSIQIFQYLRLCNVRLKSSLWLYSIHGRNPELFHLLEEFHVEPEDDSYEKYLEESIKCHHNEIVKYIQNTLLNKNFNRKNDDESYLLLLDDNVSNDPYYIESKFKENIEAYSFHYHNFEFIPNDLTNNEYSIFYMCEYNYYTLVELLLKTKTIDLHKKIVQ